jgi:hypothetical protein
MIANTQPLLRHRDDFRALAPFLAFFAAFLSDLCD